MTRSAASRAGRAGEPRPGVHPGRGPRRYSDPTLPQGVAASDEGLLGPVEVRQISQALGIRPTKTLGQNFVHDAGTVRRIVAAANVTAEDEVIEVGPGLGSLTLAILETGARLRAVEIDPPLASALPHTVAARMPHAAERFTVIRRDAMELTADEDYGQPDWPPPTKLVANLPYNVAVPVILTMLHRMPTLTDVLVMVQAEVADRLAAQPGSKIYGVPSVKAAWYGTAQRAGTISRSVFWPVPNVDSALVRLQRTAQPRGSEELRLATFEVVDVAFGQRRKTLRAAMKNWAGSSDAAAALLDAAGVDPQRRGETLTIDEFITLGESLRDLRASGLFPSGDKNGPRRSDTTEDEDTTSPAPPCASLQSSKPDQALVGPSSSGSDSTSPAASQGSTHA